jgi:heavy metal sensor kinase
VKPLALRTSLTLLVTGLLALLVAMLALAYRTALARHLDAEATRSVEELAGGLRGYLQIEDGVPVLVYDETDADARAFIIDATSYYQVYDAGNGRLLTQSPGLEALGLAYTPAEVAEFRAAPGLRDVRTDRGRIRMMSFVVTARSGESYVVQVGDLVDRFDKVLAEFDRRLTWLTLAGIVAASLVGFWMSGHALSPLSRLAEAARRIGISRLQDRLPLRGTGDELDQVAEAFNAALGRVETSVGEMRQFSAALAHELRTPLAILRGEAELALREPLMPDHARQRFASQIEEFDRLTRLINQILTLARAEVGELHLADEPLDLAAVAASIVEQLEPVAAARSIALTTDAPDPVGVRGDAGWLGRLLILLIDNAITFTPDKGRITVSVGIADGRARLAVADTGVGVPPEALPRLFTRFYRANPAGAQPRPGAGLGLALAKWIAEHHHGVIGVDSAVGRGTTFTVTLPLATTVTRVTQASPVPRGS